jgi:hypothetical protein
MKDFPNNMLEHLAPGDYVEIGLVKMKELTKAHTDYSLGNKNADLPEELKMRIDQLANPPSCGACAFHTVISGNHYCGVKVCHERKKAAWFKYKTEQASKQLKIDMYELRHGQFRVLEYRDEDLFKKRQAGLRLIERPKVSGYHYQSFKGVDDDIFLVVATGEALNKITRSKSNAKGGGKKTEKEKAEARAMRIFRPRVRELRWEYTAVAMHIFDGVPLAALERLNSRWFVGIDDRVPDEYEPAENAQASKKLEFNKRALVWRLILDASSTWHREPLADILTEMQETVPVKVPKALIKQVAEWDAEIAEAAKVVKPVAVETGKKKS